MIEKMIQLFEEFKTIDLLSTPTFRILVALRNKLNSFRFPGGQEATNRIVTSMTIRINLNNKITDDQIDRLVTPLAENITEAYKAFHAAGFSLDDFLNQVNQFNIEF